MSTSGYVVESLAQQCKSYIIKHLEEFSVSHLSLLPLWTREELLWLLPIADVCLLEDTKFVEELDMAAYWKFPCEEEYIGIADPNDIDIGCYIQEWDYIKYARAILYGQVATYAIGCLRDDFWFRVPHNGDLDNVIQFLYAVRKFDKHGRGSDLIFPPRYHQKSNTSANNIIHEVVSCFKGELPTVLADMEMYNEIELDYVRFLSEVVYLGIHGLPFEAKGLEFVKAVIKEATHLEAVIFGRVFFVKKMSVCPWMNFAFTSLQSHPMFLSNVRLLKILSCHPGYVVSREVFDNLITAYFSASTDRTQKLQFTGTKIKSYDIYYDCSPKIDQGYLLFKTIELDNCQFVSSYKSTTKTISQRLG